MTLGDMANIARIDILNFVHGRPWGMSQDALDALQRTLLKCEGDVVNLASLRTSLLDFLGGSQGSSYRVQDGKAIIPVVGPLDKRMSLMQFLFGGASTEDIRRNFDAAMADPKVDGIVLNIDSPGGSVDGTKELADAIYNARGTKPIVAYVDSNAMSAAYWIASAADKIIAPATARVGSIGVYSTHVDASKLYENFGVKKSYIYAGKYKVAGNETAPLSNEDRGYLQGMVDKYYSLFVEDVARNRGVSAKKVLNDMADGRVFIGSDAFDAGLVDKIGTLQTAMKRASKQGMKTFNSQDIEDTTERVEQLNREEKPMDLNELKAAHPNLVQALKKEGAEAFKAGEEYTGLVAENKALKTKVEETEASNKDLVKKAALAEERFAGVAAEKEMDRILLSSGVPERLHSKVKTQVDYRKYVKDGEKFEQGSAGFKEFSQAFDAEVKDWEKNLTGLTGKTGPGVGGGKTDGERSTDDDVEYGRKVAREAVGKIRSDKK